MPLFSRTIRRVPVAALSMLIGLTSGGALSCVADEVPATQLTGGAASGRAFDRVTRTATRVYFNAFDESPPGTEWSIATVSRTKKGNRPYLGDFVPGQPVTLTLGALPPHKLVRVSFDLFLQRSWDGSSPIWGATRWDMELGDGRSLIHTSFCNCGFFDALTIQGRAAIAPLADALAGNPGSPEFQAYLGDAKKLVERFPETATQLRLARTKQVLDAIPAPADQWEQIVRAEVAREANDTAQVQRLQALFPSLFGDPPVIDGQ